MFCIVFCIVLELQTVCCNQSNVNQQNNASPLSANATKTWLRRHRVLVLGCAVCTPNAYFIITDCT